MTWLQFRAKLLGYAVGAAKALCESCLLEDIKIEPEQMRKNVTTILALLHEVEDYLKQAQSNKCSKL